MSLLLPMMLKKKSVTPVEYLGYENGGNNHQFTVPAYVQAGDYCIVIVTANSSYTFTTVSNGFNEIYSVDVGSASTRIRAKIYEKIMDGTETTLQFATGNATDRTIMLFFRNGKEIIFDDYAHNTDMPSSINTPKNSVLVLCGFANDVSSSFAFEAPQSGDYNHIFTSNSKPRESLSYINTSSGTSVSTPSFTMSNASSYILTSIIVSP